MFILTILGQEYDGVYSVMNNEWVHKPKRTSKDLDISVLKTKIKSRNEICSIRLITVTLNYKLPALQVLKF